jgi:hypothetical protein
MNRIMSLSMVGAIMALGLSSGAAQAHERERCEFVKKCHGPFFHRRCETIRVCHQQHFRHDRHGDRWNDSNRGHHYR